MIPEGPLRLQEAERCIHRNLTGLCELRRESKKKKKKKKKASKSEEYSELVAMATRDEEPTYCRVLTLTLTDKFQQEKCWKMFVFF